MKKPSPKIILFTCLLVIHVFYINPAFANNLEHKIKAVLAYKIMAYIHWPSSTFDAADRNIKVGVLGDDAVFNVFKSLEGKKIGDQNIIVDQVTSLDNLTSYNSIFISRNSKFSWQEVMKTLKDSSTLTLGEIDRFAESGGMIGFYNFQDKIRFLINREKAENSGLKINAQLFRVGKLVNN